MNANQVLWEKGDFTRIADLMRASGDAFARSLGPVRSLDVLDLGCGDGTTALPLAQLGAAVTGIDIARNLVEAGRRRAREHGLDNLSFFEGDACALTEVGKHRFDLTVTVFGAMFAPKATAVAQELVRVTRPGGRIVMGNWIPNDPGSFVSQLLSISASYLPPPPAGFESPMAWGDPARVTERFVSAGVPAARIRTSPDIFKFIAADKNPIEVVDLFRRYYGPTMNAFEAARARGAEAELEARLIDLARSHSVTGPNGVTIPASFLRVEVQC